MSPANGTYIYGKTRFTVNATDNVGVSKTELYYSLDPEAPYESWNMLVSHNGSTFSENVDTTAMPSDVVYIVAKIYDAAGNYTYSTKQKYSCDNIGPEKVANVKCISNTGSAITLSWDGVSDEDISYYIVEEKQVDGTYKNIAKSTNYLGVNILSLKPETKYTYRVIGYDIHANRGIASDEITVITAKDTTAPAITYMTPQPGYFANLIPLKLTAKDDYRLKNVEIQTSYDKQEWESVKKFAINTDVSQYNLSYDLDISKYNEGSLYVRAIAEDTYGNLTPDDRTTCYEYIVDRTPSVVPSNIKTSSDDDYVTISWTGIADDDSFACYNVYRSNSKDGTFELIKSNTTAVTVYDTNVDFGATYYYKVQSVDKAGNKSELSDAVSCTVKPDTEPPKIYGVSPFDGSKLSPSQNSITVAVQDNSKVSNLKIEYKTNSLLSTYSTLKEIKDNSSNTCTTTVSLPIDELNTGTEVTLKITASDSAGNGSSETIVKYTIDKDAPELKNVSASNVDDELKVNWECSDTDAKEFYIFRKTSENGEYSAIKKVVANSGKSKYEFKDENIDNSWKYFKYKVMAYDDCGNSSFAETDAIKVVRTIAPIAQLECQSTIVFGSEYLYDATASTDDTKIVKYSFNFGDDTESIDTTDGKALHIYEQEGIYTVKLIVTDEDGNTGRLEKEITVTSRDLVGQTTVCVKDDSGRLMPNTNVYMDLGEAEQRCIVTDSYGIAVFESSVGTHTFSSYKEGYLPVKHDIAVTGGNVQVNLVLVNEPIVTGEFEIHRMTFDEIVAAGIDINAAENRHVVKINVTLYYESKPVKSTIYWNGVTVKSEPVYIKTDSGTRKLTPTIIGGSSGYGGSSSGSSSLNNPTVAYLDVPVEFSFLKEFFDVKLHIINHASSQFSLLDNTVKLNVPDGLSIVKTNYTDDSAVRYIPEIAGQSQETVNWVLRGDKAGEYDISADFLGMLSYFNEPISATFVSDQKIQVQGAAALDVEIETARETYGDRVFYNVVVQNNSEFDVNGFEWTPLRESFCDEYVDSKGNATEMEEQVTTLKPGEKFVYHYFAKWNVNNEFIGDTIRDLSSSGANVKVTVHEVDYFLDKFFEKFPEESGAYIFEVKDSSGKAVINADVDLGNNQNYKTDKNGKVIISVEDRNKVNASYLKVSADGYYVHYDGSFKGSLYGSVNEIKLYKEGEFVIEYVKSDGRDVLNGYSSIRINDTNSDGSPSSVVFTSKIYGNDITSVDIVQNGNVIKAKDKKSNSTEYTYTNTYLVSDFAQNKQISIKVTRKNHSAEIRDLNVSALKIDYNLDLELPKDASISISDSPLSWLINGSLNFAFNDFTEFSFEYNSKESTVTVGVNFDISDEFKKDPSQIIQDKLDEEKYGDFEEGSTYDDINNRTFKQLCQLIKKQYNKQNKQIASKEEKDYHLGIVGAIEFKVISTENGCELELSKSYLNLSVSASWEYYGSAVISVVPITAKVGFTLGLNAETEFVYNNTNSALYIDSLKLVLKGELETSLGVGVACASVGFYGDIVLSTIINVFNTFQIEKVSLSGEAGIYVKLFCFTKKWPIAATDPEIELWPDLKWNDSVGSSMFDVENYSLNDDLLGYQSVWNKPMEVSNGQSTLLENAYSSLKPQIAVCGDKVVMVYQGVDKTAGNTANSLALYYSIFDLENNTWSIPKKLDDNYCSDMQYSLTTVGDEIFVVYSQSNSEISDDIEISDAAKNIDIYSASFNATSNKFNTPVQITDNNIYDANPIVKNISGVPTAIWQRNDSNNPFFNDSTNSLMLSRYVNGKWSEPTAVAQNVNSIINYDLVENAKNFDIVYSTDEDADLTTFDDRSIYIYDNSTGSVSTLAKNVVTSISTGKIQNNSVVMWYEDGKLMQYDITNDKTKELQNVSGSLADGFKLVSDDGYYSIVYIDNRQNICQMCYNSATDKWSDPITLVSSENYIENLEAEYINGKLNLTYYDTEVIDEDMNTQSKLITTVVDSSSKPVITLATVDYDNLKCNSNSEMSVYVSNNSSQPTGNLTFNVNNYDGTLLGSYTTEDVSLSVGESRMISVPFTVPKEIADRNITVSVSDSTGVNVSTYELNLAKTDMAISGSQYNDGDNKYIKAVITNNASYASSARFEVYNRFTNEVYYSSNISEVKLNSPVIIKLPIDEKYVDKNGFISVRVVSKADDYYEYNNYDMFEYHSSNSNDVLIGDIDLDGVITIKDVTLLQKYLADVSDLSDKALIAADVDKDGTIDICDATKIRSYLCDFADKNIGYCGQRSR